MRACRLSMLPRRVFSPGHIRDATSCPQTNWSPGHRHTSGEFPCPVPSSSSSRTIYPSVCCPKWSHTESHRLTCRTFRTYPSPDGTSRTSCHRFPSGSGSISAVLPHVPENIPQVSPRNEDDRTRPDMKRPHGNPCRQMKFHRNNPCPGTSKAVPSARNT